MEEEKQKTQEKQVNKKFSADYERKLDKEMKRKLSREFDMRLHQEINKKFVEERERKLSGDYRHNNNSASNSRKTSVDKLDFHVTPSSQTLSPPSSNSVLAGTPRDHHVIEEHHETNHNDIKDQHGTDGHTANNELNNTLQKQVEHSTSTDVYISLKGGTNYDNHTVLGKQQQRNSFEENTHMNGSITVDHTNT